MHSCQFTNSHFVVYPTGEFEPWWWCCHSFRICQTQWEHGGHSPENKPSMPRAVWLCLAEDWVQMDPAVFLVEHYGPLKMDSANNASHIHGSSMTHPWPIHGSSMVSMSHPWLTQVEPFSSHASLAVPHEIPWEFCFNIIKTITFMKSSGNHPTTVWTRFCSSLAMLGTFTRHGKLSFVTFEHSNFALDRSSTIHAQLTISPMNIVWKGYTGYISGDVSSHFQINSCLTGVIVLGKARVPGNELTVEVNISKSNIMHHKPYYPWKFKAATSMMFRSMQITKQIYAGLLYTNIYHRKFRSETSDNMDRWKAQPGRSSGMERVRREKMRDGEDQRWRKSEERRCRCTKRVGKSWHTVFFQCSVAPGGWKVGSLKRWVRGQLARWEMKNCTLLWCEAHF